MTQRFLLLSAFVLFSSIIVDTVGAKIAANNAISSVASERKTIAAKWKPSTIATRPSGSRS